MSLYKNFTKLIFIVRYCKFYSKYNYMDYSKLYNRYKNRYLDQKFINQIGGDKFTMFTKEERYNIMKQYNEILKSDKLCTSQDIDKIIEAAKGMYIYKDVKSKNELCESIKKSKKSRKYPIVHEDSLTSWVNRAAEKYGLEIGDILKMQPGEKMQVIFMDRNIGDYIHGIKIGAKYDPRKKGLTYGNYTHKKGLSGRLEFYEIGVIYEDWTWEINEAAIGGTFWNVLKNDYKKLDKRIKVGWRGPSIKKSDAKHLPKLVRHYNTWWDDYGPFRTHNFLSLPYKK